jgi:hypothetical protein
VSRLLVLAFGFGLGLAAWRGIGPAEQYGSPLGVFLLLLAPILCAYAIGRAGRRGTVTASATATAVASADATAVASGNTVNVAVVVPRAARDEVSRPWHDAEERSLPWVVGTAAAVSDDDAVAELVGEVSDDVGLHEVSGVEVERGG